MNQFIPRPLLAFLFIATTTVSAQAALTLAFSTDGGSSFTTEIVGLVGDEYSVDVFLAQELAETRLSDDGLISFGTRGVLDNTSASIRDVMVNDDFFLDIIGSTMVVSPTEFSLVGEADFLVDPRGPNIRLGSFVVDVDSPGTTNIRLGDFDPRDGAIDFALNDFDFTGVDDLLFSVDPVAMPANRSRTFGLTITATAVPEPASFGILAACGACAAVLRRRRKRIAV